MLKDIELYKVLMNIIRCNYQKGKLHLISPWQKVHQKIKEKLQFITGKNDQASFPEGNQFLNCQ